MYVIKRTCTIYSVKKCGIELINIEMRKLCKTENFNNFTQVVYMIFSHVYTVSCPLGRLYSMASKLVKIPNLVSSFRHRERERKRERVCVCYSKTIM